MSVVRALVASNVVHSVHTARTLADHGALTLYRGPVIFGPDDAAVRWLPLRARQARVVEDAAGLPLRRLAASELARRVIVRGSDPSAQRYRGASHVLDFTVARAPWPACNVLHVHTGGMVQTIARAKRRGMVVVADHRDVHPADHDDYLDPHLGLLRREFTLADLVLANSTLSKGSLVNNGVPAEKVHILPLGVDVDAFGSHFRADPQDERSERTVLFVGAISYRKGIDLLMQAARSPEWQGMRVLLAGSSGPEHLMTEILTLRNVTYLGPQPRARLAQLYSEADVLVLPSRLDAFGLVGLEALAAGTPVVTSSMCGVSDAVREFSVGEVFPSEDVTALTRAVADVARRGGDIRTRSAEAAQQFSWGTYGDRLWTLYRSAVEPLLRTS